MVMLFFYFFLFFLTLKKKNSFRLSCWNFTLFLFIQYNKTNRLCIRVQQKWLSWKTEKKKKIIITAKSLIIIFFLFSPIHVCICMCIHTLRVICNRVFFFIFLTRKQIQIFFFFVTSHAEREEKKNVSHVEHKVIIDFLAWTDLQLNVVTSLLCDEGRTGRRRRQLIESEKIWQGHRVIWA